MAVYEIETGDSFSDVKGKINQNFHSLNSKLIETEERIVENLGGTPNAFRQKVQTYQKKIGASQLVTGSLGEYTNTVLSISVESNDPEVTVGEFWYKVEETFLTV